MSTKKIGDLYDQLRYAKDFTEMDAIVNKIKVLRIKEDKARRGKAEKSEDVPVVTVIEDTAIMKLVRQMKAKGIRGYSLTIAVAKIYARAYLTTYIASQTVDGETEKGKEKE